MGKLAEDRRKERLNWVEKYMKTRQLVKRDTLYGVIKLNFGVRQVTAVEYVKVLTDTGTLEMQGEFFKYIEEVKT